MGKRKRALGERDPRKGLRRDRRTLGQAPGTLTAAPGAAAPALRVIAFGPDGIVLDEPVHPAQLATLDRSKVITWVDVIGVGDAQIFAELGELFGLHTLALEDAMNTHQRPKVEDYEASTFIVLRSPARSTNDQLSIFVGSGFVLTIQEGPSDDLEPLKQRIRQGRGRVLRLGADYLAYAVIDAVIDRYFPLLEELGRDIEVFDARVVPLVPEELAQINAERHMLQSLRRDLMATREAVGMLSRGDFPHVGDELTVFLRDCQDHTAQLIDAVDSYRDMVANVVELHLSLMNHRMGEVMKLLTLIATMFIPMSFIAGVFGMNFDPGASAWNMPELRWPYGYPLALGLMALTAVSFLVFFWRKGWLGAPRGQRDPE